MKIASLKVQNYKKFVEPRTISFCDAEREVNDVTLLVGENGSGKSSILQAIIMLIAPTMSTRIKVADLGLPGFDYAYLQSGNMPLKVSANILFSREEIDATLSYAQKLKELGKPIVRLPGRRESVELTLNYDENKIDASNPAGYYQMSGYAYATQLKHLTKQASELFDNVGFIFWYDEQRTIFSTSRDVEQLPTESTIDKIREILTNIWYFNVTASQPGFKLMEGQVNLFQKVQETFQKVFRGRTLVGAAPRREDPSKTDFWLSDGVNTYELSGMSAAERALFPIILDFSLKNINNSIILIDEIELHLHPALQQDFIDVLPKLGKNNQFIVTTHSRSVTSLFSEDCIVKI